ncbi:MAG: YigZ family protein [Bacilli bacterium]|nr:YigZ family protein [Bacilli bacterium]
MFTIKDETVNTIEIDKSVFISYLKNVSTVKDARAYIQAIKEKYPDATHHVSAYIVGKGAEYGHYDDDGEPSGTSAMPIFDCLRKNNLTNVVCVVVRYFGGIKLGAGGLVRAYSRSASENLRTNVIVPIIEYSMISLNFNYSYYTVIENSLKSYEIINRTFSTNVDLVVKVPDHEVNMVIDNLVRLTNNFIQIKVFKQDNNKDECE